ncbi:MAG: hypothetical protein MOGMAGMI_01798 [Candidatus Omnitrophica bacterium]|nr:hypothetical protein [Candidatus Omnitrophota bacterium]
MTYYKPDIIVSWPRNCDYPLWRKFIHENRHLFNEVIIVFTETNQGFDYKQFVREQMTPDYCLFIENMTVKANEDWRDVAVKTALNQSYNSEWIWFTEQDFVITQPDMFWLAIEEAQEKVDVIYVDDHGRMHPCCIFMKRTTLNQTKRYFGIEAGIYDHFGQIQRDIEALQSPKLAIQDYYYHFNGLSHNMSLTERGEAPNYEPIMFKKYLGDCLYAEKYEGLAIHPHWKSIAEATINAHFPQNSEQSPPLP